MTRPTQPPHRAASAALLAALLLLCTACPSQSARTGKASEAGRQHRRSLATTAGSDGSAASSGTSAMRAPAFLEDHLPLKVVLTTPTELVTAGEGATVQLSGRQTLTVVFSRPAIALGSDFGEGSAKGKFPFSLDCPVPGKMRWVTTAIVRFDPDVDWPTDLACTFVWATDFTSYDGVPLHLGDAPLRRGLSSGSLDASLSWVRSERAQALTDRRWDPDAGMYGDKLPEVPPDGVIQLSFTYQVNLQLLQDALKLFKDDDPENTGNVDVGPCSSALPTLPKLQAGEQAVAASLDVNATCAMVTLKEPLAPDTYYTLRLAQGSRYGALSGLLAQDLDIHMAGLRPFRVPLRAFPLVGNGKGYPQDTLSYRRLQIWLPHGLAEGVTPDQLLPLISVCQYADGFKDDSACNPLGSLSLDAVDKGLLTLTVPGLQPLLKYRLDVAASVEVKDGYGQALLAYFTEFWTDEVAAAFKGPTTPSAVVMMEDLPGAGGNSGSGSDGDDARTWRYAVRPDAVQPPGGLKPAPGTSSLRSAAAWSVPFETDAQVLKLFSVIMASDYGRYVPSVLGVPHVEVALPAAGGNANLGWQQLGLDLPGPSSVHVVHVCCDKVSDWPNAPRDASRNVQYIFRSNLSASVVQSGATITAWVVSTAAGGGAVEGATVRLVAQPWYQDEMLSIALSCTTDANGVCALDTSGLSTSQTSYNIFVSKGVHAAMVRESDFYLGSSSMQSWLSTMVADRLVVVPGDSLKVTAFVQSVTGSGALKLPAGGSLKVPLFVSPAFKEGANGDQALLLAELDGETGTLRAEVPVPKDAKLQGYSLSMKLPDPQDPTGKLDYDRWADTAGVSFTVADPRPPTAELQVSAPSWTKPDSAVKVDVAAVSYIGASVDGAEMTLTWTSSSSSGAKGQMKVTTDAGGKGSATIDLGALPSESAVEAGSSIAVEVEWIGPTRERIVQATSVSVQASARTLRLERSLSTNLPGVAFGVRASLSDAGSGAVKGVPVSITLKPNATNGPDPAGAACAGKQLAAACSVQAGDTSYAGCQLALPCPGVFVLEGCTAAGDTPEDGEVCEQEMLGVSQGIWSTTPWVTHDDPSLETDKPSYSIGDTAVLSFQNPWPGARALVQWGNVNKLQTKAVLGGLTANGVATIPITLGDECTGGCGLTLVLDVPRQPGAPYPPGQGPILGVAVSRLFDPLGPHTHRMSGSLAIKASNVLEVAVAVQGSGSTKDVGGEEVPTVEPGAQAQVTIDVKLPGGAAADGVEVTLYAVDESFLALAPYPLPRPQAQMVLDLAAQFSVTGSADLLLAPLAVREVFAKLMARLTGIDPWLPPDTTCYQQPSSYYWRSDGVSGSAPATVDTADAAYIKGYNKPLTHMPGSGWTSYQCYRALTDGKLICPNYYDWWNDWGYNGAQQQYRDGEDMFMATASGGEFEGAGFAMAALPDMANNDDDESAREETPAPAPVPSRATATKGGPQTSDGNANAPSIRVQDDFVVTPLFVSAKADASGRATFTFTAPQNLGSFALRAFAASGAAAKYGSGEGKVVVKRRLSLTPSLPRFVRVGDAFEAGAIVTVGTAPASVAVTAKLEEGSPLELTGPAKLVAAFDPSVGVQQEVRFKFSAKAIGTSKITITAALAGDGASDGLELELDVLGQQGDVWVATSFAIAANGSTAKWQEGMELPAAVPGSGGLALTAGIGYFPTIDGFYSSLLEQEKYRDKAQPYAALALLWATQPAVFSYYGRALTGEGDAAAVARGFEDLAKLTDGELGLMYRIPQAGDWWWPTRPDLWLNLWGAYLLKRHSAAFKQPSAGALLAAYDSKWQALAGDTLATWAGAADAELVARAEDSRQATYFPGPYSDFETLAWVYYTFGKDWVSQTGTSDQILDDISFARLLKAASGTSLQAQALVALTLIEGGDTSHTLVADTLVAVTNRLRVQGRTAYVAWDAGSQSPADLDTQALSLLLLLKTSQTHLLVPKLAAYVANPFRSSGRYDYVFSPSDYDIGLVSAALAEYDSARGSAQPDLQLLASSSGITVLQASFTPTSNAPASNTTAWEDLASPPGPLQFQATGTGEVSIAASLHFVPAKLLPYPSYRGIYVESAIQLLEPFTGDATGRPLKTVPLASVVAYTVQITTPDDLGAVTISVMMPGGLEPLDPNLPGVSGGINGPQSYCPMYWMASFWRDWYWYWYWPICPTQETRPSVVTFEFDALMAGTSTVTIKAVAASVGSFVLPPVRAYADDQPEVMGMTAGGALTVCQGCQPEYAEAGPQLKGCPKDCNGNGVCNPIAGKCTCDDDYSGEDCGSFTAAA